MAGLANAQASFRELIFTAYDLLVGDLLEVNDFAFTDQLRRFRHSLRSQHIQTAQLAKSALG